MSHSLESAYNVMLDRSSVEWIAGVLVALVLALALAGGFMACRRWMKNGVNTATLAGLATMAIFAGMIIGVVAIQVRLKAEAEAAFAARENARAPLGGPGGGGGGGVGGGGGGPRGGGGGAALATRLATSIFEKADEDHDGFLSTEEAAAAAGRFIKEADESGKGALDRDRLTTVLRERTRPQGGPPGGPPAAAPKSAPAAEPPVSVPASSTPAAESRP